MSNYQRADDIVERLRYQAERLEALEKFNPLNNGTIDEGGLIINDGGIRLYYPSGRLGAMYGTREHPRLGITDAITGLSAAKDSDPEFGAILFNVGTWENDGATTAQFGDPDDPLTTFNIYSTDMVLRSRGDGYLYAEEGDVHVALSSQNSSGRIWIHNFGGNNNALVQINMPEVQLVTPILGLYELPTTGSTANLNLGTHGGEWTVAFVTSSKRYKQDIEEYDPLSSRLLEIVPKTWRDKGQVVKEPNTAARFFGAIAEDLDALGLDFLVEYDTEDRPNAISYDRIAVALIPFIRKQAEEIELLKGQVAALMKGKDK